ncbi:hypothetical protein CONPUDRAFT_140712 [Coniophora puteana RWD-64-598 SS2]|uniref:Fungal-type protein kinase domain-containing protein n=1 Tax=Coniophora puteana (strain RWD-64-598) TaxID=741705 RepID=A0A5M3N4W7_CONPW|nr:uncharacterized protein CONPUDRAFT_140712 [Coniophora puteana RWD-64-598 SS2]EIW85895.1 hypothetical protein CONPUDRAFT_140712 [Coniophora puteana RWD-64-598 SS2]
MSTTLALTVTPEPGISDPAVAESKVRVAGQVIVSQSNVTGDPDVDPSITARRHLIDRIKAIGANQSSAQTKNTGPTRLGALEFKSSKSLRHCSQPCGISDDIESFLHVVTWLAIHVLPFEAPVYLYKVSNCIFEFFQLRQYKYTDKEIFALRFCYTHDILSYFCVKTLDPCSANLGDYFIYGELRNLARMLWLWYIQKLPEQERKEHGDMLKMLIPPVGHSEHVAELLPDPELGLSATEQCRFMVFFCKSSNDSKKFVEHSAELRKSMLTELTSLFTIYPSLATVGFKLFD